MITHARYVIGRGSGLISSLDYYELHCSCGYRISHYVRYNDIEKWMSYRCYRCIKNCFKVSNEMVVLNEETTIEDILKSTNVKFMSKTTIEDILKSEQS